MSVFGRALAASLLAAPLSCAQAAGAILGSATYYLGVEHVYDSLEFDRPTGGFRIFTGYRLPGGFGLEGSFQTGSGPRQPPGPFALPAPPRAEAESGIQFTTPAGPSLLSHLNAFILPENSHMSFFLRSSGIGLRYDEGAAHVSVRLTGNTPGITFNWAF